RPAYPGTPRRRTARASSQDASAGNPRDISYHVAWWLGKRDAPDRRETAVQMGAGRPRTRLPARMLLECWTHNARTGHGTSPVTAMEVICPGVAIGHVQILATRLGRRDPAGRGPRSARMAPLLLKSCNSNARASPLTPPSLSSRARAPGDRIVRHGRVPA